MAAALEVAEHLEQGMGHAVHVREERFCEECDLHETSVAPDRTRIRRGGAGSPNVHLLVAGRWVLWTRVVDGGYTRE
ncbi:hypothetical protein GCM10009761_15360 [Agromyces terreus]